MDFVRDVPNGTYLGMENGHFRVVDQKYALVIQERWGYHGLSSYAKERIDLLRELEADPVVEVGCVLKSSSLLQEIVWRNMLNLP